MIKVQSDLAQVVQAQKKSLEELRNTDKILRTACVNTVALISERVQQEGKRTDGTKMETRNYTKTGAYSYEYGKYVRKKKGRQTDHIDLTMTGLTMDSLTFEPVNENEYVVGFAGKTASDRAEYNEETFGTIFQLGEVEQELIDEIILQEIDARFK